MRTADSIFSQFEPHPGAIRNPDAFADLGEADRRLACNLQPSIAMTQSRQLAACASLLWLLLVSLACETPLGPVRVTTFPPDLSYLPAEQLRTAMWVLAAEIQYLEERLNHRNEAERIAERSEIRQSLERMRVAARTLDEPGRSTQHPVLNENLGPFMRRLERAKLAVDRDPPDFFLATTIAGSCYLCHGRTRSTVLWKTDSLPQGG